MRELVWPVFSECFAPHANFDWVHVESIWRSMCLCRFVWKRTCSLVSLSAFAKTILQCFLNELRALCYTETCELQPAKRCQVCAAAIEQVASCHPVGRFFFFFRKAGCVSRFGHLAGSGAVCDPDISQATERIPIHSQDLLPSKIRLHCIDSWRDTEIVAT